MGLTRTAAPTTEPISAADVAAHVRIATDDAQITGLIAAARGWAEAETHRALITQTWQYTLDAFPYCVGFDRGYERHSDWRHRRPIARLNEILLPWPNLIAVSTISYVDTTGSTVTLSSANYIVDATALPGRIVPSFGNSWPATRDQANAVTITYTAGFGNAAAVPQEIKQAMLLVIADLYRNRESQAIGSGLSVADNPAAMRLLGPHIYREFV